METRHWQLFSLMAVPNSYCFKPVTMMAAGMTGTTKADVAAARKLELVGGSRDRVGQLRLRSLLYKIVR
jgi:hypothetical protein